MKSNEDEVVLPPANEAWKLLVNDIDFDKSADLREMGPTTECVCGTNLWRILGAFDDEGDLSFYFLDIVCSSCGSVAKAPTPTKEDDE